MIASRLIKEDILPLNLTDTVREALGRMNEYKVSHFPVVAEGRFIGGVSEKDIDNATAANNDISLAKITAAVKVAIVHII